MIGPAVHLSIGVAVFLSLLAGAGIGAMLCQRVPDHMLDGEAKEVVRLGMALLASTPWCSAF